MEWLANNESSLIAIAAIIAIVAGLAVVVRLALAGAGQGDIEGATQALSSARNTEQRLSLDLIKESSAIISGNSGTNLLAALEPGWPEDLLTSKNAGSP